MVRSAHTTSVASSEGRRAPWHAGLRWFGSVCLMGAAFFGGYVAWLLWGTGLETRAAQERLRTSIERSLESDRSGSGSIDAPLPGIQEVEGSAYAIIQIPRIGIDYVVVEGTDYTSLKKGPGHYPETADPWDKSGRVGIAGHRTTYLAPFYDLDRAGPGDDIVLLTRYGRFRYEVTRTFVIPAEGSGVVLEQTTEPTLVLTTCNPRFSSTERLIVEAVLVERRAV